MYLVGGQKGEVLGNTPWCRGAARGNALRAKVWVKTYKKTKDGGWPSGVGISAALGKWRSKNEMGRAVGREEFLPRILVKKRGFSYPRKEILQIKKEKKTYSSCFLINPSPRLAPYL